MFILGRTKQDTFLIQTEQQKRLQEKLIKKAISLGISEENAPAIVYHIDKLSNIIINSYINNQSKNICKT